MDYHGGSGDDMIDQAKLGLANGTNIYGGAGNDTITITNGNAMGEAGDDTLIAVEGGYAGAVYWNSPAGVDINLVTGVAQDGYGTLDKLVNIRTVQDSPHNDTITGSSASESFWLSRGNDVVTGGGGSDTVNFYNLKSTEATISYDVPTATFTIAKNFSNGDKGTAKLSNVSSIVFLGPDSDNVTITRDMYDSSLGFLRAPVPTPSTGMNKVAQTRLADFNGDGKLDILAVRLNGDLGITAEPLQVLVGDGKGGFSDQTASLFKNGTPTINYVPRIFTADFNKDGRADIFNPDFGVDAPPFPGGQNSMYLSNPATGLLENVTSTLPQGLRQNHGTAIGDINHDGYPDVFVNALNERTGNTNNLLVNDGTGKLVLSQQLLPAALKPGGFDAGWTWSMLRDLNNDGYDDIVMGTWDPRNSANKVFLNDGKGSFANATAIDLPASGVDRQIIIGIETIDLNGDALPDLMLSATNGGAAGSFYQIPYLQLLVNDGNGQFHDETDARMPQPKVADASVAPHWYLSATAIDFNGDGKQDILIDATGGSGASKVMLNDGTGKFTVGWQSAPYAHVVAGDINGDGKIDIVESNSSGYSVLVNAFPARIPASGQYHAPDAGGAVLGGAAGEKIYAGKGNDQVDGAGGRDFVVYEGKRADYTVSAGASGFSVTSKTATGGTDTLTNVERLQFADAFVALDVSGVGGQAYRLYKAAFNRAPDESGLGFHIWAMETAGLTLAQDAQGFIDSPEFAKTYGSLDNSAFVTQLYQNVLGRAPDAGGLKFHVDLLNAGTITRAQDLIGFSESPENQAALIGVIGNGFSYLPTV